MLNAIETLNDQTLVSATGGDISWGGSASASGTVKNNRLVISDWNVSVGVTIRF